MPEVEQARTPIVSAPTMLDSNALMEVDDDFIKSLASTGARRPGARKASGQKISAPPKRRGRPPGSPNKPKPEDSDEATARRKADNTSKYTQLIIDGVNDQILMVLVGMGVPPRILYENGTGPTAVKFRTDLTPVGNMVAINPSQAKAIASFLAEIEATSTGTKAVSSITVGPGALILKGGFALAAAIQYGNSLMTFRKNLAPLLEALKRQQEEQAAQANGTAPRAPTPAEQARTAL